MLVIYVSNLLKLTLFLEVIKKTFITWNGKGIEVAFKTLVKSSLSYFGMWLPSLESIFPKNMFMHWNQFKGEQCI